MIRKILLCVLAASAAGPHALAQVDANARYRHVFPQVADGGFGDGSGYLTAFVITNISVAWADCSMRTVGLGSRGLPRGRFWIAPLGYIHVSTSGAASFDRGYAVLECSQPVTSTANYLLRDGAGLPAGMASTPSSQEASLGRQVVVGGGPGRTAIALVNDALYARRFFLTLFDATGRVRDSRALDLGAGGYVARFVDELLNVPGGEFSGVLEISGAHFHAVGMYFEGALFRTVPVSVFRTFP